MSIKLKQVEGFAAAITSLKMSKRHYDEKIYEKLIDDVHAVTDAHGFFKTENVNMQIRENVLNELNKLAKWGAGVGMDAWIDDGHDTILRFIDFTFVTEGLHRAGQDDLDAHCVRFNNRIVRESTRLATFKKGERSEWYQPRIRSVEDMLETFGKTVPASYVDSEGVTWVYTNFGYVREDLVDDKDANRGNYPESIPSNAIWKINLYDLRHVYKRRNKYTHANPELKEFIEDLADQVEQAIPCDLGKLVRYDYALIPDENGNINTNHYELVHIMNIKKVYVPRTTE